MAKKGYDLRDFGKSNSGIYVNEDGEKGGFLTASSVNILIADFLYICTLCGQYFFQ